MRWQRVGDQNDTDHGEIRTEGFDDLRLHINYPMNIGRSSAELFLSGRNLTEDKQRYHTTFIKDLAPLPSQTVEAGVRVYF